MLTRLHGAGWANGSSGSGKQWCALGVIVSSVPIGRPGEPTELPAEVGSWKGCGILSFGSLRGVTQWPVVFTSCHSLYSDYIDEKL